MKLRLLTLLCQTKANFHYRGDYFWLRIWQKYSKRVIQRKERLFNSNNKRNISNSFLRIWSHLLNEKLHFLCSVRNVNHNFRMRLCDYPCRYSDEWHKFAALFLLEHSGKLYLRTPSAYLVLKCIFFIYMIYRCNFYPFDV